MRSAEEEERVWLECWHAAFNLDIEFGCDEKRLTSPIAGLVVQVMLTLREMIANLIRDCRDGKVFDATIRH